MKRILFFTFSILILSHSFTQKSNESKWKYQFNKDSVIVENIAVFGKYKYYDQKLEEDAVKFTLKITNKGKKPIPDIQTARFHQPGGLKIFINGYDAMQMSLANGMFGAEKFLSKGESESWDWDQQITGPYKADWGDEFTWQWEYMGIKSPIMKVDVKNRTIIEVSEHIKGTKVIY